MGRKDSLNGTARAAVNGHEWPLMAIDKPSIAINANSVAINSN